MTGRLVSLSLVAGFAVALGHLAWRSGFGPPAVLPYQVDGSGFALAAKDRRDDRDAKAEDRKDDREAQALYLRRLLFLPQKPKRAWIQVIGRDDLRLHVNGSLIEEQQLAGFPIAFVADLTPYLEVGQNVIGITAKQATLGEPPMVSVDGRYELSDGEHPINHEGVWRYNTVPEQQGAWWFEGRFLDKGWPTAEVRPANLRGWVRATPPRAVKTADAGCWITPAAVDATGRAVVRGQIASPGQPRRAWLRVTATSNYRVAVNGLPLDQREDQLDTSHVAPAVERIYDITPAVRRGDNSIALLLTSPLVTPHVRADVEVEDAAGTYRFGCTDRQWVSAAGAPDDALRAEVADPAAWQPCHVDNGHLDVMPWMPRREVVAFSLPQHDAVERGLREAGFMLVIGLITLAGCIVAGWLIRAAAPAAERPRIPRKVAYLALVLPALAILTACLSTYDPRVSAEAVYRPSWVVLAVLAVVAQWVVLAVVAWSGWRPLPVHAGKADAMRYLTRVGMVGVLVLVGFWIRFHHIPTEPCQWDESFINSNMRGVYDRGFPSYQLKNLPAMYLNATELVFVGPSLMYMVTDNDRYIVRFPAVVWATLTIVLLYVMGARLFTPAVGLVAAAIFALSPMIIAMSNFARYFEQLQFFCLLSLYFFWQIIRGAGPINHRALWLTAVTFSIAFLTWEGVALVAPGMIVALLVLRRGRLRTVLCDLQVWAALVAVALVVLLQYAHRVLQLSQFMFFGTSLTDVSLLPMWRDYPLFNLWFYVWGSTWNPDALLPMIALVGAGCLAFRHPFQRPIRYLLITHIVTAFITALLLSVTLWRYIHHMSPVMILLGSAALVAGVRAVVRLARSPGASVVWARYARAVGTVGAVVLIGLSTGLVVHLVRLEQFRTEGYGIETIRFPNMEAPTRFVRDHMQKGDLVIAADPHQVEHFMRHVLGKPKDWRADGWPCTNLKLPMTLIDSSDHLADANLEDRDVLRDRREGAVAYPDLATLKDVFARNDRIWFIVEPDRHRALNIPEASIFLRQHMDVVYEDFQCVVMFRDKHRTAQLRHDEERHLDKAKANYLP
jgi:hypothetical protein